MISELRKKLDAKEVSSVELTKQYLAGISEHNAELNAYVLTTEDLALEQASAADARIAAGESTPLLGIPYGVKDLFCVEGVETTACSKILQGYIPPYTATSAQALHDGVLLGKLNTDEFAMGASSETSVFGPTRNPYNTDLVAGGSSGGPAAAVAAGLAPFSLGTDTGGSIRLPAAFCGVVGLRPTYGRVSRYGVISMASSLDTIGPFTQNVTDMATVMQVIAGPDRMDSTTPDQAVDDYATFVEKGITEGVKGMRFGLPKEYMELAGLHPGIADRLREVVAKLEEAGAAVIDISLPHTKYAVPTYYIIVPSEVSSNMARYDGIKYGYRADNATELEQVYAQSRDEGFGSEVKRRIILGTYALSSGYYDAYYKKAMQVRTLIRRDFDAVFEHVDAIISPTTAGLPFAVGEKIDDPMQMYLQDVFTAPSSLAGIPGLVVPVGEVESLPVGLQILGPQWSEGQLLRVGKAIEDMYSIARPSIYAELGS